MKKYLLSLLIVPLLLIGGYSSAYDLDITFTCSKGVGCNTTNGNNTFVYSVNSDIPVGDYYIIDSSIPINNYNYSINYEYGNGDSGVGNPLSVSKSFKYLPPEAHPTISFTFDLSLKYGESFNFKLVDSSYKPPLIDGGTASFTPVITGLTNSINEFIPYVVYIGLGVLGVLIGFVAIKRLINWVRAKIFSSFK